MIRRLARLVLVIVASQGVLSLQHASAQTGTSAIRGVVKVGSTGQAIEGARVSLIGSHLVRTTDVRGEFEFADLVPGSYLVQVSAIGYAGITAPIELKVRQDMELEFITEAEAVTLPDLEVTETSNRGHPDWNRRRRDGRGRYITRADIEDRRAASVTDMMRMVPGVRVECRRANVCLVRMARAPRGCNPSFFMDGIPSAPAIAYLTPISEVEGIEIYSGPAETPPELESRRAGCGVVVIWTRVPPARRMKVSKPVVDTVLSPPVDTVSER